MRKLTFYETTQALQDPWAWCLQEIIRRNMGSRELAEAIGVPRTSLRQLYNRSVPYPSYPLLRKVITYLLLTRNAKVSPTPQHNPPAMPKLEVPEGRVCEYSE